MDPATFKHEAAAFTLHTLFFRHTDVIFTSEYIDIIFIAIVDVPNH